MLTKRSVRGVCGLAVLVSTTLAAQARPDFSGTWEMDVERSRAANARAGGGGGGAMGGTMSMSGGGPGGAAAVTTVRITQTAAALTINRVAGQVWEKMVHKLDGTESVNTNGATTIRLKSRWEGARLISEGTSRTELADGEGTIHGTLKETRWLEKDGTLVIESTRVTNPPPSIQISNAGKPRTTFQYFKRKATAGPLP